jgi:hypothetical protein
VECQVDRAAAAGTRACQDRLTSPKAALRNNLCPDIETIEITTVCAAHPLHGYNVRQASGWRAFADTPASGAAQEHAATKKLQPPLFGNLLAVHDAEFSRIVARAEVDDDPRRTRRYGAAGAQLRR